jgi:hypothetical protein
VDLPVTCWRKSSYSDGDNGSNCVEVAHWRKSSYSDSEGKGGDCVEVAHHGPAVAVRDSKAPEQGALLLADAAWTAFRRRVSV